MLELGSCYSALLPSRTTDSSYTCNRNSTTCDKMKSSSETDENFTNFRISEILKPDFGKKQITTGVLNLSCHRKSPHGHLNGQHHSDYNPPHRLHPLGVQFNVYTQDRLNVINGHLDIQKNVHSFNTNDRKCSTNSLNIIRQSGLSLDLTNKPEKKYSHSTPNNTRHRKTGSSGGESAESSPQTSPSGSPGSSPGTSPEQTKQTPEQLWPAWVYCTRYSDRPSAGPRSRKIRRKERASSDDKRPRTAFSTEQLRKLKLEFDSNKYLSESRRQQLARDLNLNESQIKIWFQNKRAKIKKNTGDRNGLAVELLSQGLYNHKTVPVKMET